MPEHPNPKPRPHPWTAERRASSAAATRPPSTPPYTELQVTTNYTFLTGASHPEEFVHRAAELGHRAASITDLHSLAGVVRAHVAAKDAGIPLVVGARVMLTPEDAGAVARSGGDAGAGPAPLGLLLYATDRASYGGLCRLLTIGKRRAPKGECRLTAADVKGHQRGLLGVVIAPGAASLNRDAFVAELGAWREVFDDDRLSLGVALVRGPDDGERSARCAEAASAAGVALVATNDVHYHVPERRALQDVLTCVRHGCTIREAGTRLLANGERHLKSPEEMAVLFRDRPRALARTVEIGERASGFSLDQLRYEYPDEVVPAGLTPERHLAALVWKGASERYPGGVPERVRTTIEHELALIHELRYEPYFLTVHDIVVYARSRSILCQGRGAAANSAVCYCLGVTSVDPSRIDLLFERFISRERNEPPDIDIDFEHERREEVIQYLYAKYGRERAALTAEVITYRGRSAVRDVGKAMGLSLDAVDRLAKQLDWWHAGEVSNDQIRDAGFEPRDPTLRAVIRLTGELIGFPRHLSQHVGGFVLTRGPLCETVPIENAAMPDRTVIEWDKDDIDALGILKVDVLGLGMLTCISRCLAMLHERSCRAEPGAAALHLHTIPAEDPAVYDMVCRADTIGVFQIESRAQMSMLPRLRPRCFYDLVIEVAIVRPGPIQGDMVHPYLRRRNGEEPVHFPDERVQQVLGKTLGIPLFQEQAMALAIVAAGFTPGEADQLRRAMAAWKRKGDLIFRFGKKIIAGMTANGYTHEFAERCFEQIKGFSEYGFPESHAASFALIVYVSAWLKRHHPAAFAAALINSQPMGFYAPAQIVRDAREHGVEIRPVDVNASDWDCTLEGVPGGASPSLRLGTRLVAGLREEDARRISRAAREHGPFRSIDAVWRASGAGVASLRRLAAADAFGSLGLDRPHALWEIRRLRDQRLPLFDDAGADRRASLEDEPPAMLPPVPPALAIKHDYDTIGLSLKAHPLSLERERLDVLGVIPAMRLRDAGACRAGARVAVAGLVLVRQRPGTASGIVFMTIEDETAAANLILFPAVYERFRKAARHSVAVVAWGKVERQGEVVHVMVDRIANLREVVRFSTVERKVSRDFH